MPIQQMLQVVLMVAPLIALLAVLPLVKEAVVHTVKITVIQAAEHLVLEYAKAVAVITNDLYWVQGEHWVLPEPDL